ncbi:hypothetical protein ACSXDC_00865 [Clostridium perfringens]|nr:hypothetical protein [Clostridium perfringens]
METDRIKLTLRSSSEIPMSCWQFQEFINNINKGYIKLDLINEISKILNKGEKPKNIIIINRSYEINNKYKYLKHTDEYDLSSSIGVERLYNLGQVQSMYPNEKIIKIRVVFKLYEKLFKIFHKTRKIKFIPKSYLKNYIFLTFDEIIAEFKKEVDRIILNIPNEYTKEKKELNNKCKKILEKVEKEVEKYNCDKKDIELFKLICKKNFKDMNEDEKSVFKNIDKNYFTDFFEIFKKIERPIILIYNEEKNNMKLIRKEYMQNDYKNKNFLDYKDYSHNSPFVISLIAGISIIYIWWLLYDGGKQEKLMFEEDKEINCLKEELECEEKKLFAEKIKREQLSNIDNLEDSYVKYKILSINNKITKNLANTLKSNGVENAKISSDDK